MATLLELAAEIVKSHASIKKMSTEELLQTIQKVHATLQQLEKGDAPIVEPVAELAQKQPALSLKQAFKQNEVICMICGRGGMKTLTRHLKQVHDLKPGEYRRQFGIPSSQPLTAKKFSEARRQKAQEINLSQNLAKAREVRAEKIKARKAGAKKSK